MKFALKNVRQNPFRDLKRFPIQQTKVESLMESIESTDFWENIEGRVVGDVLEIAYGHHRVEALRLKYGKNSDQEFNFIVRKLSDSDMIQRMARENNETYGTDLSAMIESVRATVEGLAAGTVVLPQVPEKTPNKYIRYAPSYVAGASVTKLVTHPYTALTLAVFLGAVKKGSREDQLQPEPKLTAALNTLELEELGLWKKEDLERFRIEKADGQPGVIPIDRVLKATTARELRAKVVIVNAAQNQREVEVSAKATKVMLERAEREKKEAEEENKRARKAYLDAIRKEEEDKAARAKEEEAAAKVRQAEADKALKEARKEWDANEKARKAAIEHQRAEAVKAAQRAEATRASFLADLAHDFDRIAAVDDPRYERSKSMGRDKRTTEAERTACIEAIEGACDRLMQLRVFFRPELGKKKR